MLQLDGLSLFVAVAKSGSFAAVARDRQVAPSSVSRQVARLEADLGVRLLQRSTRALVLTDAGQRYLTRVKPLLEGLSEAADHARDADVGLEGVVRATLPVSYGMRCVVPFLGDFRDQFPSIRLDLQMSDSRLDLLDHRLDLAVRLGRLERPGPIARRLHGMRYRCVVATNVLEQVGAPHEPSDLLGRPTVGIRLRGKVAWGFRREGQSTAWVEPDASLVCSNTLALRELVCSGAGFAVLPEWLVGDRIEDGHLQTVLDPWQVTLSDFDAGAWLLLPARRYVPARVRAFADWLVSISSR